jgi:uncharacterized damage-inducible protein DinB
VTPEVERLRAALAEARAGVLKKLAGLDEEQARRTTVDSGTNLAGLLQHLTFVESYWFEEVVAGRRATRGARTMSVDPTVTLTALRADYRAACAASDEIVAAVGEGAARTAKRDRDLRGVLLAVLVETARHAGHADILREQIDGRTGR